MPLRPEVGDTVVMRVRVTKVNSNSFYFARDRTVGGIPVVLRCPYLMHVDLIDEIIPKPWVPKVGDTVWYIRADRHTYNNSMCGCGYHGVTLLAIHGDGTVHPTLTRKWAVVAFEGDIPRIVELVNLRKDYASCAD